MPKIFIKIEDKRENKTYFLEWSTVVDAPISPAVLEKDFKEMYTLRRRSICKTEEEFEQYYNDTMKDINEGGVSNPFYTLKDLMECSDEFTSHKKIVEYCRRNLVIDIIDLKEFYN